MYRRLAFNEDIELESSKMIDEGNAKQRFNPNIETKQNQVKLSFWIVVKNAVLAKFQN